MVWFENVPGLLTSHGGADIKALSNTFERADYGHATLAIDAKHFVPQSRPRIFIVAAHGRASSDIQTLADNALSAVPHGSRQVLDLNGGPCLWEFSSAEVVRHLAMMDATNRTRVGAARV